jgi:hypothetical protein
MGIHLALESLLAGASVRRVLVDDAWEPCAASAWTGHRVYLAGSVATAEKLGLRLVAEFPALIVDARGNTL